MRVLGGAYAGEVGQVDELYESEFGMGYYAIKLPGGQFPIRIRREHVEPAEAVGEPS